MSEPKIDLDDLAESWHDYHAREGCCATGAMQTASIAAFAASVARAAIDRAAARLGPARVNDSSGNTVGYILRQLSDELFPPDGGGG